MKWFELVKSHWQNPPNCPPPVFPIIYAETLQTFEWIGWLKVEHVVGDVDFSGYPPSRGENAEDVIIDSEGKVFSLTFNNCLFPDLMIDKFSPKKLKEVIFPALTFGNHTKLIEEITSLNDTAQIIRIVAEKLSY